MTIANISDRSLSLINLLLNGSYIGGRGRQLCMVCCPDLDGAVAHVWAVDDLAGVAQRQRSQADLGRVTVPVLLRHP